LKLGLYQILFDTNCNIFFKEIQIVTFKLELNSII